MVGQGQGGGEFDDAVIERWLVCGGWRWGRWDWGGVVGGNGRCFCLPGDFYGFVTGRAGGGQNEE
jgi:hypothetical protein